MRRLFLVWGAAGGRSLRSRMQATRPAASKPRCRCNLDAFKRNPIKAADASARQGYIFHTVHLGRRDACATLHIAGTEGSRLCAPVCLFCSH